MLEAHVSNGKQDTLGSGGRRARLIALDLGLIRIGCSIEGCVSTFGSDSAYHHHITSSNHKFSDDEFKQKFIAAGAPRVGKTRLEEVAKRAKNAENKAANDIKTKGKTEKRAKMKRVADKTDAELDEEDRLTEAVLKEARKAAKQAMDAAKKAEEKDEKARADGLERIESTARDGRCRDVRVRGLRSKFLSRKNYTKHLKENPTHDM